VIHSILATNEFLVAVGHQLLEMACKSDSLATKACKSDSLAI